jgi:hypothetical protein
MRVALLGASTALAIASVLAFACGTQLSAPPTDDAGVDVTEPAEPPLTKFGCGVADCVVNEQVCCIVGGDPTCARLADGCNALIGDAGTDGGDAGAAPKPLQCTTYRVCSPTQYSSNDCCWSESTGSQCKNDCAAGELRLCQDGDGCGPYMSCEPIPDDPLGPNVRRCVLDGSSSGGWSSGGP